MDDAPADHSDGCCDVLVLGPSVWSDSWGDLGPRLQKALAERLGRPVRVYNLSEPGHCVRDALVQYRRLEGKRFDLVVLYHGINDCRFNNIPPEYYRPDFSHHPRFAQIHALDQHPEHAWWVTPYTVRCLAARACATWPLGARACSEWNHFGIDLKTPPDYRRQVEEILDLARERGDRVLLLTAAYHIPDDYTQEGFSAKTLDYDRHLCDLEGWGTPESVRRGVGAHNAVVRELAAARPEVLFADLEPVMPGGKAYFDDWCHLNPAGCERFIGLLMGSVAWEKLAPAGGKS